MILLIGYLGEKEITFHRSQCRAESDHKQLVNVERGLVVCLSTGHLYGTAIEHELVSTIIVLLACDYVIVLGECNCIKLDKAVHTARITKLYRFVPSFTYSSTAYDTALGSGQYARHRTGLTQSVGVRCACAWHQS
mgnify:CR=1 FL=1